MKVTFDPNSPVNNGIDYQGIPDVMVGKPSKGTDTGKWDEIILAPDAVVNGAFVSARCIIVTSQEQATPATMGAFVRTTTNGNYIVKVKRDAIPDAVKLARKQANDAQKADWKANGPKARTVTAPVAPVIPGQAPTVAPTVETAPVAPVVAPTTAPDDEYQAFLAWKASQATTAPVAPKAPTVPTTAPKAPKAPKAS